MAEYLTSRGWSYDIVRVFETPIFPRVEVYGLLVVLGGPMSANDTHEYTWLALEKLLVGRSIALGVPTFGVCLGAQLIAVALGSPVYPARGREIGFGPIAVDPATASPFAGAVASWGSGVDEVTSVLHWHGETFDLPVGAALLASTDVCTNQMFSYGRRVLGMQFHLEVKNDELAGFVAGNAADLAQERSIYDRVAEADDVKSTTAAERRRAEHLTAILDVLINDNDL